MKIKQLIIQSIEPNGVILSNNDLMRAKSFIESELKMEEPLSGLAYDQLLLAHIHNNTNKMNSIQFDNELKEILTFLMYQIYILLFKEGDNTAGILNNYLNIIRVNSIVTGTPFPYTDYNSSEYQEDTNYYSSKYQEDPNYSKSTNFYTNRITLDPEYISASIAFHVSNTYEESENSIAEFKRYFEWELEATPKGLVSLNIPNPAFQIDYNKDINSIAHLDEMVSMFMSYLKNTSEYHNLFILDSENNQPKLNISDIFIQFST